MTSSTRAAPDQSRAGQPWWMIGVSCIVAAIAFVLAFPPYSIWPLVVIPPLALTWAAREARSALVLTGIVFATQFAMWMWLQQWTAYVTQAGYPVLCAALSCYTLLYIWLARRWFRSDLARRVPAAVSLALLWTAVEVFRGEVAFDGYPWFLLAHPLIDAPYVPQIADLSGAYAVSFLVAMVGGSLHDWLPPRNPCVRCRVVGPGVSAVCLLAACLYGALRAGGDEHRSSGPRVLAIQTNLPQDNKIGWTVDRQLIDFATFVRQTREAHSEAIQTGPVDLIVWPETMLPGRGLEPAAIAVLAEARYRLDDRIVQADFSAVGIRELQAQLGVPILVGSPSFLGFRLNHEGFAEWETHYNSAYLVTGDPPYQRYDKVFLTPFGETMPYISAWPWLEEQLLGLGAQGMSFELEKGGEIQLIRTAYGDEASRTVTIATPICFEDTVSGVVRRMVWDGGAKRVDLLVNLSNDGWFGDHDAGRSQHLQIARYRAIENRLFMVRAVNTGRTTAIDSSGNLVGEAGGGRSPFTREPGVLVVQARIDQRATLFGRIGNLFGYACLLLTLGWFVWSVAEKRRGKGKASS